MSKAADWNTGDYQRIVGVERHGDELGVHFGDGSEARVDARCLLPPRTREIDWEAMTFDPYEIVVSTAEEQIEIPWSAIRALTDRDYATHLAEAAKEQARQIGRRIRELRKQRGLTSKEVAERARITPQSLSRIENGHHDVVYTTLQQILAAMGASLKDLVEPAEGPATIDGSKG